MKTTIYDVIMNEANEISARTAETHEQDGVYIYFFITIDGVKTQFARFFIDSLKILNFTSEQGFEVDDLLSALSVRSTAYFMDTGIKDTWNLAVEKLLLFRQTTLEEVKNAAILGANKASLPKAPRKLLKVDPPLEGEKTYAVLDSESRVFYKVFNASDLSVAYRKFNAYARKGKSASSHTLGSIVWNFSNATLELVEIG